MMKQNNTILRLLATAALLVSCGKKQSTQNSHAADAPMVSQSIPRSGTAATRLSLAEATVAVRKEIFRWKPSMNPSAEFPLKEITTSEVWDRLHAQVFVVTEGVYEDASFIICNRQISPLAEGFGGFGVMSMCVADLTGDGRPKLFLSHSWGSGMHRSLVGVWIEGKMLIDASPALREYDLTVQKIDDNHVNVAYGLFNTSTGVVDRQGEYGSLNLLKGKTDMHLEIILNSHLPDEVRSQVWR
jgi:hypothetical protein